MTEQKMEVLLSGDFFWLICSFKKLTTPGLGRWLAHQSEAFAALSEDPNLFPASTRDGYSYMGI